ncbi:unnamed protein product [Phaedon cochleariae]|uniref:SCP domain-containing protein n=1 Tax=Phaedon cochleariae TaxID=80249 RepID=A0A9P0GQL2_PHACE|nr:unnamed protein product [Phaedon cochleariae]
MRLCFNILPPGSVFVHATYNVSTGIYVKMKFHPIYIIFFYCNAIKNSHEVDSASFLTQNRTRIWYKNLTDTVSPDNPYCKICCIMTSKGKLGKACGKHTMCIYNDKAVGPSCRGFLEIPFSNEEIEAIVDAHNTMRNKVAMGLETRGNPGPQPPASNMRAVQWDKELALIAERWAAQCIFANDICRDSNRYPVGQNIAKGSSALNSDLSFIIDWYNNVDTFARNKVNNFQVKPSSALSQYTQLIWAETYQIGCARVAFQRGSGSNVTYREHFICNYGPMGNIPRHPVYKIGEPCSNCPDGTGCTVEYRGLCGSEKVFEVALEKLTETTKVLLRQGISGRGNHSLSVLMYLFILYLYIMIRI